MDSWQVKIAEKRFAESVQGLYVIVIGRALLFFACVLFKGESFLIDKNAQLSLTSAFLMFGLIQVYDWKSWCANMLVTLGYLIICVLP